MRPESSSELGCVRRGCRALGAAAVFLSLIYLAAQTKQNTQALRPAAFHQVRDSFAEVSLAMAQNPELLALVRKAAQGGAISQAEETRVSFVFITMTRKGESAYLQSSDGSLQLESWLGIRATSLGLLSNPRWRLIAEGKDWKRMVLLNAFAELAHSMRILPEWFGA